MRMVKPQEAVQQGCEICVLGGFQHLTGERPEQPRTSLSSFEDGDRSETSGGPSLEYFLTLKKDQVWIPSIVTASLVPLFHSKKS